MTRAGIVTICAALILGAAPALSQDSAAEPGAAPAEAASDAVEAPDADAEAALDAVEAPDADAEAAGGEPPSVEESAILPSADDHDASRAPSMELDCAADPSACVEPLDGPSEGPDMASPDDPSTAGDESEPAEPVTATP